MAETKEQLLTRIKDHREMMDNTMTPRGWMKELGHRRLVLDALEYLLASDGKQEKERIDVLLDKLEKLIYQYANTPVHLDIREEFETVLKYTQLIRKSITQI